MKTLVTMFALLVLTATSLHAQEESPLFRHASVDHAWQASQESGRPMLLFVTSGNCHFCTKMLKETYTHPQIAEAVASSFEPAVLSREVDPDLVKDLGVRAFPTTLVIAPDRSLLARVNGFVKPQKFADKVFTATAAVAQRDDRRASVDHDRTQR